MPSTYSTSLRLELQANGENAGTWGDKTNTNLGTLLEQAIAGLTSISVAGNSDVTLTAISGQSDQSRPAILQFTGVLTGNINVIVPTAAVQTKKYLVYNNTSGAFTLTFKAQGGTGLVIPQGGKVDCYCDGTNVVAGPTAVANGLNLLSLRSYLAGLTLSNDGGTPNTVLDIAAGLCADSTNAVMISLGAFTKSISGAWVAGTGGNGMGNGLTATASTFYHVFSIVNSGTADVYFDTSVVAANAPTNTTAFRRIGSIRLDSSVHILSFTQTGDRFDWGAPRQDISAAAQTTGAATTRVLTLPPGVVTEAMVTFSGLSGAGSQNYCISSTAQALVASSTNRSFFAIATGTQYSAVVRVMTDTSASVSTSADGSGSPTVTIDVFGWIDTRGKLS